MARRSGGRARRGRAVRLLRPPGRARVGWRCSVRATHADRLDAPRRTAPSRGPFLPGKTMQRGRIVSSTSARRPGGPASGGMRQSGGPGAEPPRHATSPPRRRTALVRDDAVMRNARESISDGKSLAPSWTHLVNSHGPYDWFTTHTFVVDCSPALAVRLYDRWLWRLIEGCRRKSRRAFVFRAALAVEWTHAERVHLHSVIAAPGLAGLPHARWRHRWEGQSAVCGMARVHSARGTASAYLAKYTGKGGAVMLRGSFARWPRVPGREVEA